MATGPDDGESPVHHSTWWVGRASSERKWWRDAVAVGVWLALFTCNWAVDGIRLDHAWPLVVGWLLVALTLTLVHGYVRAHGLPGRARPDDSPSRHT
jgi:hypothetical protein